MRRLSGFSGVGFEGFALLCFASGVSNHDCSLDSLVFPCAVLSGGIMMPAIIMMNEREFGEVLQTQHSTAVLSSDPRFRLGEAMEPTELALG